MLLLLLKNLGGVLLLKVEVIFIDRKQILKNAVLEFPTPRLLHLGPVSTARGLLRKNAWSV